MIFNSYPFLFYFLPITFCVYYLACTSKSTSFTKVILLLASYAFIAYANPVCLVILLISSGINYLCNRLMKAVPSSSKQMMVLGVIFNLFLLGYFKYTNFLIDSINVVFGGSISALNILLPLGISFYSFQQIAYLVDNYRGEVPEYGILDYFLFTAYFPKVIQGPIVYHNELIPQLKDREKKKFNPDSFSIGLMIFSIGLFKKVLVADNFGKIVDFGFDSILSLNSFEAVLVILGYTLQIYFDFSGYCDMAVGVSKMLNIGLPVNFNSPYKAININDFWKRWHITLTRFLTKYIYIPLGGNRMGRVRTYVNIIIVFIVSGIWHGAGYTFIVWGALHGIASIFYRLTKKIYDKIPRLIQWCATFVFVSFAWTFFRAHKIGDAILLFSRVFAGGFGVNAELTETLLQPTFINVPSQILPFNVVIIMFYIIAILIVALLKNSNEMTWNFKASAKNWIFTFFLLILSILSISGVSTFLYSNF